jgi:hypothetical protein
MSRVLVCAALIIAATSSSARAGDVDYFETGGKPPTVVTVTQARPRTTGARLLIGGLIAGMAASLGVGVYYNLDSRSAANDVSARTPTGKSWTPALQATYDRAGSSGTKAEIGYGLAGAFAIGVVIAMWQTDPGEEQIDLAPHASVVPTPGGAIVGAAWGF